ncbi:MAG: response regulator [Verrucomicrobiaceae bacterium]|nr:MAG: response regulator [Verrucomicrobiaceae bacterium]
MKTTASGENRSPRLLVVDDEEGLLYLMVDALRRENYEVEGVDSGEAAITWLKEHPTDLLLLDLKLSDLPAPVLVQRLRQRGIETPFIVVTGHGDERTAVEIMKQGALDYVMKDTALLEFLPAIVRRALAVVERERKLVEANDVIRQREQRHQKVIQTALDGFVRFDESGRLHEVNESLCTLLDYTPEEMLRLGINDIDATLLPGGVEELLVRLRSKGALRFSTRLSRRDGRQIEAEVSLRADQGEFFGFVHDVSEQRRLEREVLEISEDERRRFGRELHDGLGQQLTALELMSHTLTRTLRSTYPELAKSAQEIAQYTRQAITQTRQLAHGLAPVRLQGEGLMVALSDLASLTTRTGVTCEFVCETPVNLYDTSAATHLYRIAQEAVNNALKYSKAKQITLALEDRGSSLELTIEDDGLGLPEEASDRPGMGLQVIQYRARLIGARVEIHSKADEGVRIVCTIPKQR